MQGLPAFLGRKPSQGLAFVQHKDPERMILQRAQSEVQLDMWPLAPRCLKQERRLRAVRPDLLCKIFLKPLRVW